MIVNLSSFGIISWMLVTTARQKDLCGHLAQLLQDDDIIRLYKIHTGIRSGLALSTSVWLITVSCLINNLINLGTTGNFSPQKRQILIVNVIFNMAFTCWSIYEIAICIHGFPQSFRVTTTYYILCAFSDFLPISLVLYTQFKSIHSLNRVFLLSWAQGNIKAKNESGDMKEAQPLVVYLAGDDILTEHSREKDSKDSKATSVIQASGNKESTGFTNSLTGQEKVIHESMR